MADFGDNFDVDPAAEFLAREQDQLAGLEDELKPSVPNMTNGEGTGSFEMINTLGQGDSAFDPVSAGNEIADMGLAPTASSTFQPSTLDFFSSPGEFDSEAVEDKFQAPSHFEDSADKQETSPEPSKDISQSTPTKPVIREEPEKIKKWRDEQKKRLEDKDTQEEKTKTEMREKAKKELEEWYKQHNELIAKTKADNRNAEKQFVAETDAIEPGTEWERIAKLCDFNPKSSRSCNDTSRMRSIILQLKQSPVPVKH